MGAPRTHTRADHGAAVSTGRRRPRTTTERWSRIAGLAALCNAEPRRFAGKDRHAPMQALAWIPRERRVVPTPKLSTRAARAATPPYASPKVAVGVPGRSGCLRAVDRPIPTVGGGVRRPILGAWWCGPVKRWGSTAVVAVRWARPTYQSIVHGVRQNRRHNTFFL